MSPAPWSVPVRLAELNRGGLRRKLEADEAARARIAKLLNLVSLESLSAYVEVAPWLDGASVHGRWSARVVQLCSISVDEFATDLAGEYQVRCVPPSSSLAQTPEGEIVVDPDAEDPPDVLDGDAVDLGACVVEHLALELDPFPRAPGVEFEAPQAEPEPGPFAKLAALKPERGPD